MSRPGYVHSTFHRLRMTDARSRVIHQLFLTCLLNLSGQLRRDGQVIILNGDYCIKMVLPANEHVFTGIHPIQGCCHLTSKISYCQLCHNSKRLVSGAKMYPLLFKGTNTHLVPLCIGIIIYSTVWHGRSLRSDRSMLFSMSSCGLGLTKMDHRQVGLRAEKPWCRDRGCQY